MLLAPRNSKYDGDLELLTVELTSALDPVWNNKGMSSLTRLVHQNFLWN